MLKRKDLLRKSFTLFLASVLTVGVFLFLPVSASVAVDEVNYDFIEPVEHENDIPEGFTAIHTPEDLDAVRSNLSGKYILMNDIDLAEFGSWIPIGIDTNLLTSGNSEPFTGVFDGNGFVIKNLNILEFDPDNYGVGLFGVMSSATVKNLGLSSINIDITAEAAVISVGSIAGRATGSTIHNCFVSGSIKISTSKELNGRTFISFVGGVMGSDDSAAITTTPQYTEISSCCNLTNIISTTNAIMPSIYIYSVHTGGIAGIGANIEKCYNKGTIRSVTESNISVGVGGIAGYSEGHKYIKSNIKQCYNTGALEGISEGTLYIGGISGRDGRVVECYNTGNIVATAEQQLCQGGIMGHVINYGLVPMSIDHSSTVKTDSSVENCYYSNDNIPLIGGSGATDSPSKLSDEQMRQQESFVDFDFEKIWVMPDDGGYPVFKSAAPEVTTDPDPDPVDLKCWEKLPGWLQWILRIFLFGWIWMRS
ncbi:MAG: hypothetical protein GX107_05315 [Clostridiales bacterium]|jgi:hypothetical protein|nr:hypothetical protein [Clostridiales bacterium]